MSTKHPKPDLEDLTGDEVEAWEADNAVEILAALAEAESAIARGAYREFDLEAFLIDAHRRREPART